jgi:hypothetical protein
MSESTLKVLLAVVLMFHGVGHGLGILSAVGVKFTRTQSADSAVLENILGERANRIIGLCVWVIVAVCFILSGLGLLGFGLKGMWQPLAIFASILSLLGLVFYWNAFPLLFPHKIGAIAVDTGTIVCLLWLKWPSNIVT